MYRISLTGAQGTGKSTLARAISARFRRDGVVDLHSFEGAGDAAAREGLATGEAASAQSVRFFADLLQRREAAATGSVQVFDRCLLDTVAYAEVLACMPCAELHALRQAAIASCRQCAQLLWLRVTQDYPVLTGTDETPEFRRAIDAAIGRVAQINALPVMEAALPPQRVEDVADEVAARWRQHLSGQSA